MATTTDKYGNTMMDDPDSIKRFQLIALRGALKLQAATGMRPNYHTNPRAIAKKLLGLKTNDYSKLLAELDRRIDEVTKKVEFIREGDPNLCPEHCHHDHEDDGSGPGPSGRND